MSDVLIFGASSALAQAIAAYRAQAGRCLLGVGRALEAPACYAHYVCCDYSEEGLEQVVQRLRELEVAPAEIWCCVGVLHDEFFTPEKRLEDLSAEQLSHYFAVNTIIPALILKYLSAFIGSAKRPKVAFLSAQAGSIGDNALGGWYGYRASKAALNMLVKTASIELARRHRDACLVALHPGTTRSALSEPFVARIPSHRLYTPETSAERLVSVMQSLGPDDNGGFFHWSGEPLPW